MVQAAGVEPLILLWTIRPPANLPDYKGVRGVKRLGLIVLSIVVLGGGFVVLGFWLSVGRDPSAPSGDAALCSEVAQDLNRELQQSQESGDQAGFRGEFAAIMGAAWPRAENPDLKSVLQKIAEAGLDETFSGNYAALKTICNWS